MCLNRKEKMEAGGERKGSADPADTGGDESADHKTEQDTGEGTKTSGAPPAAAYTLPPYLHAVLSKEHRPWSPSPSLHDQQTPPYTCTTFAHHPCVVSGGAFLSYMLHQGLCLHHFMNKLMK